MYQTANTFLQT